jgi:periplasmic protein TonB
VATPSARSIRKLLALTGSLAVLFTGPAPASADMAATSAPKPLARAKPAYPRAALRRGLEGSVLLEFSVDPDGNVVAPRVIESRPRGVFDEAALEALSKWKYEALGAETSAIKVRLTFRNGL